MYNKMKLISATNIIMILFCSLTSSFSFAVPARIKFSLSNSFAPGGIPYSGGPIANIVNDDLRLRVGRITWKNASGQQCSPDDIEPRDTNTGLPMVFPSSNSFTFLKDLSPGCYLDKVYMISQFWDINEPATNTFTISNYDPARPIWETQTPDQTVTIQTHFETISSYTAAKNVGFGSQECSSQGCDLTYEMALTPYNAMGTYEPPCYTLAIKGNYTPFNSSSPNVGNLSASMNPGDISFVAYGSFPCPIYDKYAEIY